MNPDLLAALRDLEGSVITAVVVTPNRARIVASGEDGSVAITLIGCEWADDRCRTCTCHKSRVRVVVE
jgi:hypothetical protein